MMHWDWQEGGRERPSVKDLEIPAKKDPDKEGPSSSLAKVR